MSVDLVMRVQELEGQLQSARITVSRSINVLEQVKIALEEDDHNEALRLINEAVS